MRNMKVSLTIASVVLSAKQDKKVAQIYEKQAQYDKCKCKRQITTSRELGLGITATPRDEDVCRCSLPWREATSPSPLERWMLPRRRFSTTSCRPWGGLQTLTNFSGVITMVDSSPNDSYHLGVTNLQE